MTHQSQQAGRCAPLFRLARVATFLLLFFSSYCTTPVAYGVPERRHARRRTMSIRGTPTIAFFLEPLALHTRENFASRTGSFRIAIQEFSMRVALMNPDPIPVIRPFTSVSPDQFSLQVSRTKLAIFLPVWNSCFIRICYREGTNFHSYSCRHGCFRK